MCGIVGIIDPRGVSVSLLERMADSMAHRGPDGAGTFVDGAVGLGHRRLAVIDLSPAAAQPMRDAAVALTYNGEIYNFVDLRTELEQLGHRFTSRSDSEVLLRAYLEWGDACLERLNGMFAFALWDQGEQRVLLARDRLGVKPLYWWRSGDIVVFGSEIKAMLMHPRVHASVDPAALDEYFTFQNVLSDRTLFEGIRILPAGTSMVLTPGGEPIVRRYWELPFGAPRLDVSMDEGAEMLRDRFTSAVTRQLVADVPVGAYLSGGLDSGSITSVAASQVQRLHTFTGGFDLSSASGLELGYDERATAEFLANRFKTEHYEVVLHAGDMEHVLPDLIWHLEDLRVGQCYPNWYAARLASRFATVVLSGAGGDELFGGYPWRYASSFGKGGREPFLRASYGYWQRLFPDGERARLYNAEMSRAVGEHAPYDVFRAVFDRWPRGFDSHEDRLDACLYLDLTTFLHGLLVVEDKLSMAHSLETRVPFLDNDLVDLAVRMPAAWKVRRAPDGSLADDNVPAKRRTTGTASGKVILRKAMAPLVPAEILTRGKQGFSAPDASWFRGESIDYVDRLLRDPKASIYEFLRPGTVADVLDEHRSGRANRRLMIWSLLSFEWWCRRFL